MSGYDDMNCRGEDPELFYPLETDRAGIKKAKAVCAGCPALETCLRGVMEEETGLTTQYRHGVRAGLTPVERYRLSAGKPVKEPVGVEDVKECVICKSTMERGKRSRAEFERLRFCSRKCYGQTLVGKQPRRMAAA